MRFPQIFLLLLVVVLVEELAVNAATPSTSCPQSCGNLTIPYPFGTSLDCCRNESFLITCNDSKPYFPAKQYIYFHDRYYTETLNTNDLTVLDISLDGELRVSSWLGAYACYNKSGGLVDSYNSPLSTFFPISSTKNKFTVVGCDTYAYLQVEQYQGSGHISGCMSMCDDFYDVVAGSCSGIGCCQTLIREEVRKIQLSVSSYNNHTDVIGFNPCGVAFLAEEGSYTFFPDELFKNITVGGFPPMPVVLDWAIGDETCEKARTNLSSYACGQNSICYNSTNVSGYLCNCSQGYQGNPYLSNGCQDINECLNDKLHNCTNKCNNTAGSFNCYCPKGFHGDGVRGSQGCIRDQTNQPISLITLGLGVTVALFVGCFLFYWGIKRKKLIQLREKFFQQNGGLMLQQQLSKLDSSTETAKIFTIEEVKKATNNFSESGIVGRGGFGIVYKGILSQNKIVAIKKSFIVDQSQVNQFINEMIVLSQINHRNVVKLLGCCLETEVPLLVSEFITNGTLYHHLHEVGYVSSIPWEIRLRIAKETAGALAYLHSAASIPIIHRDVKSTNILLDDNFTAKVSDFGSSRLVPLDKTRLTTMVQGTFGYLDPEYFHTSHLSEKSDTYSFGVVLAELLTGLKALSFDKPEEERNLATYFLSSMKENRLSLILDDRIVNEGNMDEMLEVANIAQSCLRLKGDERPTMRKVAMELEGLTRVKKHLWTSIDVDPDETEFLLSGSLNSQSITTGCDSLKDKDVIPLEVDHGHLSSCSNLRRTMTGVPIYQGPSRALKWDTI